MWGLTSCNGVQDAPTFGLRMPATARRRGRRMRTAPNSPPLGPRASLRPGSAARPKPAPVVTEYWMGSDETGTRVLGASDCKRPLAVPLAGGATLCKPGGPAVAFAQLTRSASVDTQSWRTGYTCTASRARVNKMLQPSRHHRKSPFWATATTQSLYDASRVHWCAARVSGRCGCQRQLGAGERSFLKPLAARTDLELTPCCRDAGLGCIIIAGGRVSRQPPARGSGGRVQPRLLGAGAHYPLHRPNHHNSARLYSPGDVKQHSASAVR
jgi:hypothetical protein